MTPQDFKQIRETLGLSQRELANELGWGPTAYRKIQRMESGEDEINAAMAGCMVMMQIDHALGPDLEYVELWAQKNNVPYGEAIARLAVSGLELWEDEQWHKKLGG